MKNIIKIHDDKFRSICISNNFLLDSDNNGLNAILALILSKSCKKYKTEQEIEIYLASLYGADFDIDIQKVGNLLNIEFSIKVVNDHNIENSNEIINKSIEFLNEIIYNHGKIDKQVFKREKNYILDKIQTKKDEKLKYSVVRTEELLCNSEKFGKFVYGDIQSIENINIQDVELAYQNLLKNSNNKIIITGNLNGIENLDSNLKVINNNKDIQYNNIYTNLNDEILEYSEKDNTSQAVITLGMKVENLNSKDFYALSLYNSILGGSASSKLFQNVREKESLAYTVKSRYYRFKGIFIIYAGIEKQNYKKAKDLIIKEIENMKNNISDIELESSKQDIINSILEWEDSKVAICKSTFSNIIEGRKESLDEMIENIKNITKQDIYDICSKIKIQTVYLLSGEDNE